MFEKAKAVIEAVKEKMQGSVTFLDEDLKTYRAGKANPAVFNSVMVNYYGTMTPIPQVASISTPDAKTMLIQPWDRTLLRPVEKAIMDANLGFTPQNNGEVIRINVPAITEERRKELVKKARTAGENAKVAVRNARRDAIESLKKLQKEGLPEDSEKDFEDEVQKLTGLGQVPVIAVAGHDTGSAVAAVPAKDEKFAYLSSGTWSLMGIETKDAIISDLSYERNFTNDTQLPGASSSFPGRLSDFCIPLCDYALFGNHRQRGAQAVAGPDGPGEPAWARDSLHGGEWRRGLCFRAGAGPVCKLPPAGRRGRLRDLQFLPQVPEVDPSRPASGFPREQ